MKVCIYSRISTDQQDTTKQSVALSEWAKQRGFEVIQVYEEKESAWKCGRQRVLASLIADTSDKVSTSGCGLNALNIRAKAPA